MADIKKEDVLVYLEKANMLEISELIKEIEDKFGVTAAVPVAIAGGAAPAGDAGAVEEKSEFDIELTVIGLSWAVPISILSAESIDNLPTASISNVDPASISNVVSVLYVEVEPESFKAADDDILKSVLNDLLDLLNNFVVLLKLYLLLNEYV